MNNVLEVFTGNPFNTPVGQRIEKATDGSLEAEDWALNMEICDIINETEEGPKEAVRAIRKKISNSVGKDWRSITYCLVVLETCVKNCGKRFHIQVANKDFLHDLVKVIAPKNEPTVLVQEKILSLIQSWADAFRGAPDLKAVEVMYQDLKAKGIEFPATDLDHLAPIHTPKGNPEVSPARPVATTPHTTPTQPPPRAPAVAHPPQAMAGTGAPTPQATPAGAVTAEQMSKLRADIDIVQGNCRVFNEMLNTATPGSSELTPDTTELLRELARTCRQMQQRVVVLIEQLADEQVTEVLLRLNDDLNNAFLRYDRLERFLNMPASGQPSAAAPVSSPAAVDSTSVPSYTAAMAASTNEQSLIDFGGSSQPAAPHVSASALAAHVDGMNLTPASDIPSIGDTTTSNPPQKPAETDEFDVFAQSRQYDATQHSTAASYAYQTEAADNTGSIGAAAAKTNPYMDSAGPSATSSEFDQFLSERVAAGDKLPEKKPEDDGSNRSTAPAASRNGAGRQMHKDDSENALFAL